MSTDVAVVGAGPVGLALALQAADHGAAVRIVERRTERFRPSRALMVHARTLELLRPLGVTAALLDRADTAPRARLHLGARAVPVELASLDLPDTAFPHLTLVRQMDVETVLEEALAARGVRVERGVEVRAVRDGRDTAVVELGGPSGHGDLRAAAVAGCDGVDSTVREAAGIGWRGGTYDREVVLADVDLDGDLEPGVAHVVAGRRGLVFVFALGERAPWRLLATRPCSATTPEPGRPGPPVPLPELRRLLADAGLAARITAVAWSSSIRLQHRTATRFRRGRLFLAGDAAHASSPAGGQGMNAGLHDATNLGWKLALAQAATASESLLGSYDVERRPAVEQVLALTHLLFWAESSTGRTAALLRGRVAPLGAPLVPFLLRRRRLVAEGARLLARLDAGYRGSPVSAVGDPPRRGRPRPGDRLPDATVVSGGREVHLHALIARPGVHLLLDRDAPEPAWGSPLVHVHRVDSSPGTGALALRPDGHVGCSVGDAGDPALTGWLRRIGAGPVTRPEVGMREQRSGGELI
ncbi:2-polyprenyl-6-methoxyphenol hydroxylase [Blastococcus aggregatus]|uniref:2-polyprenyl-6-methoxyphenol hydroxylase n=1 Tax=Blastococcus aggregatus TaxID=38502 RepID=A0A285V402_9ACTN|nr:FAD-dependent monooxygenase [Blastococcus aggregatus]SOC48832.1 2-polyprenyl-6-methoxyphenol hydroxylase [Blastococcus aggregatus]